jgi:hypothetical protein
MFGDDRHAAESECVLRRGVRLVHRRHNPTRRISRAKISAGWTPLRKWRPPDSRDSARTTGDNPAWAGVQAYN